uniref:Uncharacterized protein n=1 Tax=viral metagenome TaxID=1070528 RepID=A0A6C0DAC1_9ZZZZ
MFTKLFLQTTNPNLSLHELFSANMTTQILISDIFHTIIYTSFFNLANYIFFGKILSNTINTRLIISLFIIMLVGYYARFFHVKDIYNAYNRNLEKTRNHTDKLYISWLFIA